MTKLISLNTIIAGVFAAGMINSINNLESEKYSKNSTYIEYGSINKDNVRDAFILDTSSGQSYVLLSNPEGFERADCIFTDKGYTAHSKIDKGTYNISTGKFFPDN